MHLLIIDCTNWSECNLSSCKQYTNCVKTYAPGGQACTFTAEDRYCTYYQQYRDCPSYECCYDRRGNSKYIHLLNANNNFTTVLLYNGVKLKQYSSIKNHYSSYYSILYMTSGDLMIWPWKTYLKCQYAIYTF